MVYCLQFCPPNKFLNCRNGVAPQGLDLALLVVFYFCALVGLFALNLVYADSLPGSFTASILFWTLYNVIWRRLLEQYLPNGNVLNKRAGCSKAVSSLSLVQQVLTLPLLFILAVIQDYDSWDAFFYGPWSLSSSPDSEWEQHFFARQVHTAIIGFLLQSHLLDPPKAPLIAHHIFAIAGCSISLFSPLGAGIVTVNAVNAELGSAIYNFLCVQDFKGSLFRAYVFLMTASNSYAIYLTFWEYLDLDIDLGWRASYAVLCVGLVLMRQSWVFVEINTQLRRGRGVEPEEVVYHNQTDV